MSTTALPRVYLARHGETLWSLSGQHTGRSDIPLTERGEREAKALAGRLHGLSFAAVFTSPLQRARRTCELAGFGGVAQPDPDLMEWNYGNYEGRTSADIRKDRAGWDLFRDGCPGGETIEDVGRRADHVVARLRAVQGDALVFSHGHFLRFIAVRWLGLALADTRVFQLSTASVSVLTYERKLDDPVVLLWNDVHHLEALKT